MHPLAAPGTLWVLSRVGKYLVRPQADETSHKTQIPCGWQRKEPILLFLLRRGFRLCGGDQGAFCSPPGPLRGPPLEADGTIRNESVVESKGEPFLPLKSGFPLPGKPDSDRWPAFVNNRRGVGNKPLLFCRGGITALPRRAESDARPASGARRG